MSFEVIATRNFEKELKQLAKKHLSIIFVKKTAMRKLTFLLLITGIAMDSSIYAQILYKDSTVIKTDKGYEAGKTTPNYKYTSAHDKSGNLISVLNEQWNGAWTKNYKDQFEYNASGKLTKELYQRWHESSWENKYQYRFEWEYDTKGNKVSGTRYSFNENKWGKFILYSFSYNEKNQILSKVSKITDNGIDVNDEEHTYSYDEKDRLTQILLRKWHTGKSSWQNSEKTIYEYHENGLKKAEIKSRF